jgi:hypothetical protein
MSIISNARRMTVMAACAASLTLALGTLAATASMATASTSTSTVKPLAPANACGRFGAGTTSWSTNAPPPGGTPTWNPLRNVWVKQPPGCRDYNIVWVASTGNYAGFLQRSNGTWFECAAGYIRISAGQGAVECTSVSTGTHMTTDTLQFPGGVAYHVNY